MPIKQYKPTSPGRRNASGQTFAEITKKRPEKSLVEGLTKSGGRGGNGRVAVRFRGGRAKRYFTVTARGLHRVKQAQRALQALWNGIPELKETRA